MVVQQKKLYYLLGKRIVVFLFFSDHLATSDSVMGRVPMLCPPMRNSWLFFCPRHQK